MIKKTKFLNILALLLVLLLISSTGVLAADATVKVIDKYGNITLDILTKDLLEEGFEFGDLLLVEVNNFKIEAPFVTAYSDVDNGTALVRGPAGVGENPAMLAINMGNFTTTYNVEEGTKVEITLVEKEAYLAEWTIRQLTRTNNREDYASDEIFANFRPVNLGKLAPNIYYRASSPVNPDLNRANYVDELVAKAQIQTIINLADSQGELDKYFSDPEFNSPYTKNLYDQGKMIYLSMGVDFKAPDFQVKLKKGLEFLGEHEGPYLIHCNEGKDRAGFVAGLLQALMGATVTEIKEDYMQTYINYYGVEYGSEQYHKIAESNILESLRDIAGLEKGADLSNVDLVEAAEGYLRRIGLSTNQIKIIKLRLSTPIFETAA